MSGLGGILGGGGLSVSSLLVQGAAAVATGGTSLMVSTAMRGVMLAVGDAVLQQIGQQMGLPQGAIDLASAAMHGEAGDIGGARQSLHKAVDDLTSAAGGSSQDAGDIQNGAFDAQQYLLNQLLDKLQNGDFNSEGNAKAKAAKAAAGGGAAAGAAGGAAASSADGSTGGATTTDGTSGATSTSGVSSGGDGDSFLLKLAEALGKVIDSKMDQMVDVAKQIDAANGSGDKSQTATLSAKETALGQEVSLISNALNTAIKSLGDAASTLARKE